MKYVLLSIVSFFLYIPMFCQSFQLTGDGNWYRIASMGGQHAYIKYRYSHATAHNPSFSTGEFIFINARSHAIQEHHAMGYQGWNQPQFAIINFGNSSEIWVKASGGVLPGLFLISDVMNATIYLGDISDSDLSDNGGTLKIYDKLRDETHTFIGNFIVNDGQVGIGKSPEGSNKLDVAGTIRATEIKVEAATTSQLNVDGTIHAVNIKVAANGQTADFVFEDGYDLKDLTEVEKYIKEHKHLPNIPSATEMEASGVDLAVMNKLLLQKVEELTLYSVIQDKQLATQDVQLSEQENKTKYYLRLLSNNNKS